MAIVTLVMIVTVLMVTVLSCISDVRSLRIPNMYALIILVCFVPAWFTAPVDLGPIGYHIASMGIMFIVSYLMFCKGMMGGGDSKFGTALGLWVGLRGLVPFVFYMALMGGILGLITLFLRKKKPFTNPRPGSWVEQVQTGHDAIPYGVAISFGCWAAFFHAGLVDNQLNEIFKIIH